jgi:Serine aminopeptidase, S33
VLIHGTATESSVMNALAKTLNAAGTTVYAPDLRGHGASGNRGDIDYIGQLDDDLVDLIATKLEVSRPADATHSRWLRSCRATTPCHPRFSPPPRRDRTPRGRLGPGGKMDLAGRKTYDDQAARGSAQPRSRSASRQRRGHDGVVPSPSLGRSRPVAGSGPTRQAARARRDV